MKASHVLLKQFVSMYEIIFLSAESTRPIVIRQHFFCNFEPITHGSHFLPKEVCIQDSGNKMANQRQNEQKSVCRNVLLLFVKYIGRLVALHNGDFSRNMLVKV